MDGKRLAPLSNRDRRNPEGGCDLLIVRPLGRGQDDAATQGQRLRRRGGMDQLVERAAGLGSELDRERDTGHAPSISALTYYTKNYLYDVLVFIDALSLAQEAVPTENPVRTDLMDDPADQGQCARRPRPPERPDAWDADPEPEDNGPCSWALRGVEWSGREGGTRTRDLPVPNRARYQASLLPETDVVGRFEPGRRLVP